MKSVTPPAEARFTRISVPLITSLIVALCCLLYWQAGQLRHHQQWVSHSYQVRLEIETLDRSMREAESIQRAMLLTGSRSSALQINFTNLIDSVGKHLASLRSLVSDNPKQTQLVDSITPLVTQRLQALDRNSRDLATLHEAERTIRILGGVEDTNKIEAGFENIRKSESSLLATRADAARIAGSRLLMLATGGTALGVIVMVISMIQENRSRKLREKYQSRLADARDTALDSVKATSVFVASVSHEIRTPMNGVLGAADLLRQDGRLDRRQLELVDTIRYSGEALLDLVNDILDLSKLQAGKMEFIREDFSLAEILDESLALFSDAAGRKHLELAHRIDPDLPRRFSSDPRRIRQVLVNLIGNAVKFTEKGSVAIEVSNRHHGEDNRPTLLFRITDTGPGISADEQAHLFQPFSQVNVKLNRKHSGTGLGLAISREIVERLGGTMGVDSTPNQGSTFWFTAKLDRAKTPEERSQRLCDGGKLLLIESRELTATSIEQHVKAWGMNFKSIAHASELSHLPETSDLAVVVIGQPRDGNWQETAAMIAKRADAADKPVFLLNHGHDEPSPNDLKKAGIKVCLRFPFRPSDLYNLLTADPHEQVAPIVPTDTTPLPHARILLVEDNPINQRIFTRQIELLGLNLEICSDGGEGVEARKKNHFDLVLMDCQLPTMDGFEATRMIRQWEKETGAPRIPVIAITAHVMIGDAEACYQSGMDDFLPKPFDLAKLKMKLVRWLGSGQKTESLPEEKSFDVIDNSRLAGCLTGESEIDQSLISDALAEIQGSIGVMRLAVETKENSNWRNAAHRALGTSGVLGFVELAEIFRAAEHDEGNWQSREASLQKLDANLQRVRQSLISLGHLPA